MIKRLLVALAFLSPSAAFAQSYNGPTSAPCTVQANLSCTPVTATNPLAVSGRVAANLATVQVSVATTATLVAAARSGRTRLIITQSAAGPCFYGSSSTVSTTTGARLTVAGASKTYNYSGALYGICSGGAVIVDVDEEY